VAQMRADLRGEIVGVGVAIRFETETGHTIVTEVLPGTPAEKGGLLADDRIVNINGRTFKGQTSMDVIRAIRGPAGEPVKLTVLRNDELIKFELVRATVTYSPVRSMLLPDGIGYVLIHGFSAQTVPALKSALAELGEKKVRGLVFDLRDNQGGAFDETVATANLLLPEGTGIVRLKKRDQPEELMSSKGPAQLAGLPLVVLIDGRTSSGAELLAAALVEGRGAQLVGGRTLGKWSVQKLWDLSNGYALKYTVGLFETPSGQRYDGVGLAPDVEVAMEKAQIDRAQGVREPVRRLEIDGQLRAAVKLLGTRG
jgi:carboxyl-terminal processing protease